MPFEPAKVGGAEVGTATFAFANGNAATFAYTGQFAGMPAPVSRAKPIVREVFAPPGTVCR